MSSSGPKDNDLLDALRHVDEPTAEDRERVRSAVLARIAMAGGAGGAAAAAGAATKAAAATAAAANAAGGAAATKAAAGAAAANAAASAAATKAAAGAAAKSAGAGVFLAAGQWKVGIAVLALGAAAGAGTWWMGQSKRPAAPQTAPRPMPAAQRPNGVPYHAGQREAPATREQHDTSQNGDSSEAMQAPAQPAQPEQPAQRPKARWTKPLGASNLDPELRLLAEAQLAMKQGDPRRALKLLDEHAAEHPSGVLSEERAGLRAIALCEAGKVAQGRAEARRFLARSSRSPLVARIRAACMRRAGD